MAMLSVRNIPDDVHRALVARAAKHGRSLQDEIREILTESLKPQTPVRLGDALVASSLKIGLTNKEFEALQQQREKAPAEPLKFE